VLRDTGTLLRKLAQKHTRPRRHSHLHALTTHYQADCVTGLLITDGFGALRRTPNVGYLRRNKRASQFDSVTFFSSCQCQFINLSEELSTNSQHVSPNPQATHPARPLHGSNVMLLASVYSKSCRTNGRLMYFSCHLNGCRDPKL
jgi:hypothetical protein